MKIDTEKCIGCEACHPYCPVRAIAAIGEGDPSVSEIIQEECVECGVCLRSGVCPTDAICMPPLGWPRSIRAAFSNPLSTHRSINEEGRGTEEMKTNDVTGRFPRGIAGVMIEMGRPGTGTTFKDLQLVSAALAKVGVDFEEKNPVTALMENRRTGEIKEEILNERVLSAIIELRITNDRVREVLRVVREVSQQIGTVFSLSVVNRVNEDGSLPAISIVKEAGFLLRPNTKTNVGLGRPLKEGA